MFQKATIAEQLDRWRKLLRFVRIYGPGRTLYKAAGRMRLRVPQLGRTRGTNIGLIGCGQFAFATIGYYLQRYFRRGILACYDVDEQATRTLARSLRVLRACSSVEELFETPELGLVYIASDHASHADYAARALDRGLDVYVEKPIAVTEEQLLTLLRARVRSVGRLFAGYNRPFSKAICILRSLTKVDLSGGITLGCFIVGHRLGPEHWYRRPEQGTRVCGNIGHWLDLFVHMLCWRSLPDKLDIAITWADYEERDDNICIAIRSDRGDLFSVILTSRNEPFEGINETINFQHGDTTARIDDFRRMTVWQAAKLKKYRFWPKDVGHREAIGQPFALLPGRAWHEVELSTLLMLHITEMVRLGEQQSTFSFAQEWTRIEAAIDEGVGRPSPTCNSRSH